MFCFLKYFKILNVKVVPNDFKFGTERVKCGHTNTEFVFSSIELNLDDWNPNVSYDNITANAAY